MRIHWNISFIKSIFINLSNSMSLFSMFYCYCKSECLRVVCLFFIFKLHCLKTSTTNAFQMVFRKTSATFLTDPFTFSKFLVFCFAIWLSKYWFNTIIQCGLIRSSRSFYTKSNNPILLSLRISFHNVDLVDFIPWPSWFSLTIGRCHIWNKK